MKSLLHRFILTQCFFCFLRPEHLACFPLRLRLFPGVSSFTIDHTGQRLSDKLVPSERQRPLIRFAFSPSSKPAVGFKWATASGSASVHPPEWAGERRSSNRLCLDIAIAFAEPCWGLQPDFCQSLRFRFFSKLLARVFREDVKPSIDHAPGWPQGVDRPLGGVFASTDEPLSPRRSGRSPRETHLFVGCLSTVPGRPRDVARPLDRCTAIDSRLLASVADRAQCMQNISTRSPMRSSK